MSQIALAQAEGIFIAELTDSGTGAYTYGTPRMACTAAEVGVTLTKAPQKVHESGKTVYNRAYVADAAVTVQTQTMLLEEIMKLAYGLEEPSGQAGYEVGGESDAPQRVAIGWPVLIEGGKYLCTWFYDATMEPPDESYKTSNEQGYQFEPQSFPFSAVRRRDTGKLRRQKIVADKTAMLAFFAKVDPESGG